MLIHHSPLPRPADFPLKPIYLGSAATVTSFIDKDSSSRVQMATTQLNQSCVLLNSDVPRILTGFEDQLKDATFGLRVPEDCRVYAVIEKYRRTKGIDSVNSNPLVTIIYQSEVTGEFGCMHLERFQSQSERVHDTFTYPFNPTPRMLNLKPEDTLYKDEVLSASPNVKGNLWASGLSLNVAYYSSHATIEDGFEIADDVCERASPLAYGSRVAEIGRKYFPRNLYGTEDNYKAYPDIGSQVRDDGLVFSLVEYSELFDHVTMTAKELQRPDMITDITHFGEPGATVQDVNVHTTTNEGRRTVHTPVGMEAQPARYYKHIDHYNTRLLEVYEEIKREMKYKQVLSGQLTNLIKRALAERPNTNAARLEKRRHRSETVHKTWRGEPIDEWRIEVYYTYLKKNGLGGKLSNMHGG